MKWRKRNGKPTTYEYLKDGMHRGDRGTPDRLRSTDDAIRDNLRGSNNRPSEGTLRDHRIQQVRKLDTRFDRKRDEHARQEHDRIWEETRHPNRRTPSEEDREERRRHDILWYETRHPKNHRKSKHHSFRTSHNRYTARPSLGG